MRVYLAIEYHPDARNRLLVEAVSQALAELMRESFRPLESCDLALLELSVKGADLGVEAGYAHALGKPVVIARDGSYVSPTLRGVAASVHHYGSQAELARVLSAALAGLGAR